MGPLANERRIPALEELIQDAVDQGAELKTGGRCIGNKGYFFEPTVLANVPKSARIMNEEPFGPVAVFAPFATLDDAIEEANRLPFGLASYAFTGSASTANQLALRIEAGMTTINHNGLALPEVPFGGIRIRATAPKADRRRSTPISPRSLSRRCLNKVAETPVMVGTVNQQRSLTPSRMAVQLGSSRLLLVENERDGRIADLDPASDALAEPL